MAKLLRKKFRRVLVDVDTQYDLIRINGRDKTNLLRHIRRVMAWARVHKIPVISTAMSQRADCFVEKIDNDPLCVEGTPGQKKIRYTMLGSNVLFGPENRLDLPRHLLTDYRQIIFEKRSLDPFLQPRADRLLTELRADEYIVFGLGFVQAIQATALGLLHRKKRVLLITDALGHDQGGDFRFVLRKIEAKGARLIRTTTLTGNSHLKGTISNHKPWLTDMLSNAKIG